MPRPPRPEDILAFPLPRTAQDAGGDRDRRSRGRRRSRHHRSGGGPDSDAEASSDKPRSLDDMMKATAGLRLDSSGYGSSSSRGRGGILHPPNVVLSPRADAWIYLAVSATVGASSLARAHARSASNRLYYVNTEMGAPAASIVALLALEAAMALGVGVAYRFRPSLAMLSRLYLELIAAAAALLLWAICMALFNSASVEDGLLWEMARSGSEAWDANVFYSLWISGIFTLYVVSDLCAGNAPTGRMPPSVTTASAATNTTSRIWILLLFASVLLCSFSVAERLGPVCRAPYLPTTPYCTSTTVSLTVSVISAITCLAKVAAGRLLWGGEESGRRFREASEGLMALPVLVGYACNAGFTTGPGGSGSDVGNLYVASWLGLILALLLNVEYLSLHFARMDGGDGAAAGRGGDGRRATYPALPGRTGGTPLALKGGEGCTPPGGLLERGDTDPEDDSEDDAVILPPDAHQLPQIRYLHTGDRRDGSGRSGSRSGSGSGSGGVKRRKKGKGRGRDRSARPPAPPRVPERHERRDYGLQRDGMLYSSTLRSLGTERSEAIV